MIGWKRIVITVGEKIGKSHLTYAQGASAELVAMATIMAADSFGLPVSTTHVSLFGNRRHNGRQPIRTPGRNTQEYRTRLDSYASSLRPDRSGHVLRGAIHRIQRASCRMTRSEFARVQKFAEWASDSGVCAQVEQRAPRTPASLLFSQLRPLTASSAFSPKVRSRRLSIASC